MGNLWQSYVIVPMTWMLNEVAHLTGSYALAIIAFTIFIRLLLYPLTIKQLKSSRMQMALQPQLQELRKRYGDDRVKLNEETMRLYRENNANPVAGCLPTLIQFPILIALYSSLYALLQQPGVHAGFLWVRNLALPDFWSVTDPLTHHQVYNGLFILPILAAALQWVQQRMMMNTAASNDPQQKMMYQMMQFLPLMVIFFGFRFPAGLALYWVTNTLVSIVLQYFVTGWGTLPQLIPVLGRIATPGAGIFARNLPPLPASVQPIQASQQVGSPAVDARKGARANRQTESDSLAKKDGAVQGDQRQQSMRSSTRPSGRSATRIRPSSHRRQGSK